MTLDERINKYNELNKQQSLIKEEMESIKSEIVSELENNGVTQYVTSSGELSASVTYRETFKYNDESSLVNWCKQNNRLDLISEKIKTTQFNNAYKSNKITLNESVNNAIVKNTTIALTVKEIN